MSESNSMKESDLKTRDKIIYPRVTLAIGFRRLYGTHRFKGKIKLFPGEYICSNCEGYGYIYTNDRKRWMFQCDDCHGEGITDWIQKAMG